MDLLAPFQYSTTLFLAATGLLGLLVGSFLNVVIHRLPGMLFHAWRHDCRELLQLEATDEPVPTLWRPRSHCPQCGATIRAIENIPVLSYLFLRGRCARCRARIPLRYPLVELLAAALAMVVAWRLGVTAQAAAGILLTWGLIALSFIDLDHQILPDAITLPGIWLGLLLNLNGVFVGLDAAVVGAVAGYVSLWLLYHVFRLITGKEGMGFGDFKLFALFGAWFGWQVLPLIILLAAVSGAVVGITLIVARGRDRNIPIPFGPYLAIAGWIAMLWGAELTGAYMQLSGMS